MLHQPHRARGITVVGLPQAFGLQPRLLVLVGPVRFLGRGRAGRARVGLLLAEVCAGATGFHVFRGDGVDATAATLSRGRAVRAPAVVFQTLRYAPSGWTCSSSALRFRVDTAGPVSSLTMAPRSPAGGFVVTSREVGVGGFPQPFCNERSCFGSGGCVGAVAQFIFVNALGLVFCILKHARRHAFAVITLRAAPFRARNFARIFVVMGASDAALKLADRGGAGRVAGLVLTLLKTEALDVPRRARRRNLGTQASF